MATIHIPTADRSRTGFMISPLADSWLIIGSPVLALGLTWVLSWALGRPASGIDGTWVSIALGMLIGGHVVVTLVHTHGNRAVFRRHPWRFGLVPALVLAALVAWPSLRVAALVVAVPWDIHHGSMQTFGLARLYARRAGNLDGAGRAWDLLLCHATYAGPLLAGAGLAIEGRAIGAAWSSAIPGATALAQALQPRLPALRLALVVLGLVVVAGHAIDQVRRIRRGDPVSPQAAVLMGATTLTSIVSWGLNPFAMALFTMKLFHCVQYFALVAHVERGQVAGWLRRSAGRLSMPAAMAVLLVPALLYGLWARLEMNVLRDGVALSVILTVTLMHYWYDGFTWSAQGGLREASPR